MPDKRAVRPGPSPHGTRDIFVIADEKFAMAAKCGQAKAMLLPLGGVP
jgi:hypothetical protein